MKKMMLFAMAVAAMALVSCNKEQPVKENEGMTVLHFGIADESTKTTVSGAVNMVWTEGDDIAVVTGTSGVKTFTLSSGAGTGNGTFVLNEVVEVQENATSFYPASLSPYWSSGWHVTVPDTYVWSERGLNAPMISWINNASPYFHLLGAVIKVDVYDIPAAANKLVFTTVSQNVSGEFILNSSNGIETATGSNNTITITFDAGSSANKTFYVPVPAGTYTNCTFSVQSATETFKTVKAASITVEKDQLFFAPAITLGTTAKITLVNTDMDCSKWSNWNQKDGLTTSVFEVGGRLRFHVTEGSADTYWQLQPKYAIDGGDGWAWVNINTFGLVSGQTAFDLPLTETMVTAFKERNSIAVAGYNVTVNSIEYIPVAETVLWEGEHELGNWTSTFDVPGLNTDAFWSGLKADKELSIYFYESALPDIGYCQFFVQKKSGGNVDGLQFDAGTNLHQTVYSYTLTADQVTAIKDSGIVINGKKITITKITLR